ncbi:MAG: GNAT family N-acetyltransferase [Ahniella sp.]|nr:GNAT family N-acetyltransferase [Ahniella sp.]
MTKINIHQATRDHVPGIQRVRAAVRENRLVSRTIADSEVIEAIESTGRGFVALVDGEVVGFSIGHATTGNIWALFVDPDFEGLGIGRRLFDVLLGWLGEQGLKELQLSTDPGTRRTVLSRMRLAKPRHRCARRDAVHVVTAHLNPFSRKTGEGGRRPDEGEIGAKLRREKVA